MNADGTAFFQITAALQCRSTAAPGYQRTPAPLVSEDRFEAQSRHVAAPVPARANEDEAVARGKIRSQRRCVSVFESQADMQ